MPRGAPCADDAGGIKRACRVHEGAKGRLSRKLHLSPAPDDTGIERDWFPGPASTERQLGDDPFGPLPRQEQVGPGSPPRGVPSGEVEAVGPRPSARVAIELITRRQKAILTQSSRQTVQDMSREGRVRANKSAVA